VATKNNPGRYDCYAHAAPDEPLFVLLARDKHAGVLVYLWSVLRELDQEDKEKVQEARDCCNAMFRWQRENNRKTIGLGHAALAAVMDLVRMANVSHRDLGTKTDNEETNNDDLRRFLAGFDPVSSTDNTTVVQALVEDLQIDPTLADAVEQLCGMRNALAGKALVAVDAGINALLKVNAPVADNGLARIGAEQARQRTVEGWTPEHDQQHSAGDLAAAAGCYAHHASLGKLGRNANPPGMPPQGWPWEAQWWKPGREFVPTTSDRIRELEKAGALCASEIDRLLLQGSEP
jgi:hypothetical protein